MSMSTGYDLNVISEFLVTMPCLNVYCLWSKCNIILIWTSIMVQVPLNVYWLRSECNLISIWISRYNACLNLSECLLVMIWIFIWISCVPNAPFECVLVMIWMYYENILKKNSISDFNLNNNTKEENKNSNEWRVDVIVKSSFCTCNFVSLWIQSVIRYSFGGNQACTLCIR